MAAAKSAGIQWSAAMLAVKAACHTNKINKERLIKNTSVLQIGYQAGRQKPFMTLFAP
jgi:hypothetical protein